MDKDPNMTGNTASAQLAVTGASNFLEALCMCHGSSDKASQADQKKQMMQAHDIALSTCIDISFIVLCLGNS
jgi:hypothetical protein